MNKSNRLSLRALADQLEARLESLVPDVLALKESQSSDMTRPGHHYRARGMEKLARSDGDWRPRAWIDWLEMVAVENTPARLLAGAKEALAGIADGLNIRVVAADHLVRAAIIMGDHEAEMLGRWEAYRADGCLREIARRVEERRCRFPNRAVAVAGESG